jgi:amino acid transporter
MVAGTLIGTLTPVVAIGPNIMAVFNGPTGDKLDNIALGTILALGMLAISVVGIRLSAGTQVAIGILEYAILIVISVLGLVWVLSQHAGSFPITRAWFTRTGLAARAHWPPGC